MGGLGYVPYSNTTVQGEVEAEVEGSEGATVSRPLPRPQAPEIRLADLVRRVSRLDGRGREAGDGEGAGEKDSRRNPDAAQGRAVPRCCGCLPDWAAAAGRHAGLTSWASLEGAGGCSWCLVPDPQTQAQT